MEFNGTENQYNKFSDKINLPRPTGEGWGEGIVTYNNTENRYNKFSDHLKVKFGARVYKITLDAGFTCPNRDGTISTEGCIF